MRTDYKVVRFWNERYGTCKATERVFRIVSSVQKRTSARPSKPVNIFVYLRIKIEIIYRYITAVLARLPDRISLLIDRATRVHRWVRSVQIDDIEKWINEWSVIVCWRCIRRHWRSVLMSWRWDRRRKSSNTTGEFRIVWRDFISKCRGD